VRAEQRIEVPSVGGRAPRELPRSILAEIVEPRLEEIFALVQRQVIRCGLDNRLSSGVVLTGGAVEMEGVAALAERVFAVPVRIGSPIGCDGLDETTRGPGFASAVGLSRYGVQPRDHLAGLAEDTHLFGRVRRRMVGWLKELM
jgi:cell division protein FtsA